MKKIGMIMLMVGGLVAILYFAGSDKGHEISAPVKAEVDSVSGQAWVKTKEVSREMAADTLEKIAETSDKAAADMRIEDKTDWNKLLPKIDE